MIIYITGTPGAGKTLGALELVEKIRADREALGETVPIFYWRIEELTLPGWEQLAGHEDIDGARAALHTAPAGSIIVADEIHKLAPQRGPSKPVPPYVEMFDEHRHRGHDFVIMTQAPEQLDHYIKYRVGRHIHLKRKFGMERSVRYEWNEIADVRDKRSFRDAVKTQWPFPKYYYGKYKSADRHTKATAIPWRKLAFIACLPLVAVAAALYAASKVFSFGDEPKPADATPQAAEAPTEPQQRRIVSSDPTKFSDEQRLTWIAQWLELARGHPHSQPFYEDLMRPQSIPKIDGCMHVQSIRAKIDRCQCNTQQGTVITSITYAECMYYLENGWFDPFQPDEERDRADEEEDQGNQVARGGGARPQQPQSQAQQAPANPFNFSL